MTTSGTTSGDIPGDSGRGALVGRQFGGYRLDALLGVGGMAEVYRARELALDREVAVKVLPAALAADPDYVRRFRTEAKRFAALEHPHIVPVYNFNDQGPLLYLVMPVFKESLRERLDREGRLPPDKACRLAGEVASALEMAHMQGLVHRDVKPENVLLDEAGQALLTDFGIARQIILSRQDGAQTLSGTGLPVGTPEYMAPEQLRNGAVDQRADIYGLGAVLYELLTGTPPHTAESPFEVAALVLASPLTPPSAHNPQIWPALEQVMLTALASRPENRYQDAASFADALHAALLAPKDEPATRTYVTQRLPRTLAVDPGDIEIDQAPTLPVITVVRPSIPAHALTALRRQRTAAMAAVAVLALLALGGGTLFLSGGFGLSHSGVQTIFLPGGVITATPQASATTAAALATALVQRSPSATSTINASATAVATPPQPTATGAGVTPTTSSVPLLSVSPVNLFQGQNDNQCQGLQFITNNSSQSLGWQWQSNRPSLPANFTWNVGNTKGTSAWPPQNNTLAAGKTDYLWVSMSCAERQYSLSLTDSLGRSYPFTLTSP